MKIILALLFAVHLFGVERIIALSPSINEIIYALGGEDKIVGNTEFCDFPLKAKQKPKVGGYFAPSLEKALSLKPDLVIMQDSSQDLANKLQKLGIQTKVLRLATLEDIRVTIYEIGEVLDKKKEAKKILDTMQIALEQTKNIVKNKKILMVIGHNTTLEKRIFVVGQNLYFDDIIEFSGNTNALQSSRAGQPILNLENIMACNPDIVILLAPYLGKNGITKEALLKPWQNLPITASKNGMIYIEDKEYAGISSDRVILFLRDFKGFLQDAQTK